MAYLRIITLLLALSSPALAQTTFTSVTTGPWDDGTTWGNPGSVQGTDWPLPTDNVIISAGDRVTMRNAETINDLTINTGGVLDDDFQGAMTVDGNLVLDGTKTGSSDLYFTGIAGTSIDGTGIHNSSGDFIINGAATILSSAYLTSIGQVVLDDGITVTNNGTIILSTLKSLAGVATWINAANSTLHVSSTLLGGTGILQASAPGNTVIYSGAGQTIKDALALTYFNLTIEGTGTNSLSNGTIILGDLLITSATLSAGSFSLGGNFTNTGDFAENSGTITFDGTGEQTITRTGGETFYNIVLDKTTGTLNLANNVIAANSLTMTKGLIDAGTSMLTLGTGTGNEGTLTYTAGQIIGQFERWIASGTTSTNIVFPVGTVANANPATINFNGMLIGGTVIFQFIETFPGNAGMPVTDGIQIFNTFAEGYWDMSIDNSFNLGPNDFTLNLDGTGFTSFTIDGDTRLLTRDDAGSNWLAEGTHDPAVSPVAKRLLLSSMPAQYAFGDDTPACIRPSTSVITGTAEVCTSQTVAYSVVNTGGSAYAWTITGGTQASGTNTSSITVDWGATGVVGNVRVVETNSCTRGPAVDFPVYVNSIAPTSISGKTILGELTTDEPYSVSGLVGYTYTWTITGGTQDLGGTTSSITVDWGAAGIGNVSVVAQKAGCVASAAFDVDVVKYLVINSAVFFGDWDDAATWDTGTIPLSTENARILNGHTVNLPRAETINHFIIDAGGTLLSPSKILTVDGDIKIDGFYSGGTKALELPGTNTTIDGTGLIQFATSGMEISGGNKTILPTAVLSFAFFANIHVGMSVTVTNKGSISIVNDIIGSSATGSIWINDVNSQLKIGGSIFKLKGILTASAIGNHIIYNGAAQDVIVPSAASYYHLALEGSAAKTLDGDIQINGDFDVNGTSSLDAASNSASVTLSGTTAQTVTDLSSGIDFYDLIINNTFGTMPQITTSGIMKVANSATFTDGVVDNTGTFTFTDATATSTADSYIDGAVAFIAGGTNTAFTYPIGDGAIWARLGVSSLTSTAQFTAQYFFTDPLVAIGTTIDAVDFPNPAAVVSNKEYWQLDWDGGVQEANVTLYWEDGIRSGISDLTDLTITKWDGTGWGNDGGLATSTSGTTAVGSVTTTSPYSTFSPFSFASPQGFNALPVELVYFRGKLLAQGAVLEWQTASELDNDFFEVEVSTDGENYSTLANIEGRGTTTEVTNYEFVDRYPSTGLNYYRLRQVDFNGDFTYSNIISVFNDAPARLFFSAYPQPASSHLTLQLMVIDDTNVMNLVIYNMNGRIIKNMSIDPLTKQLPIDIAEFTSGLYLVRLNQANQAYHGKLLIQK